MIRHPAVAGMFYPDDKEELQDVIDNFLKNAPETNIEGLQALILPHAGYPYSGQVAASGYTLLKKLKKKKIILLGPSHNTHFSGVLSDDNSYWETPLGKVKIASNEFPKNKQPHLHEHNLEVHIPFLQTILEDFELIPLVAGKADPQELSVQIEELLDDDTFLIISTDLSHYKDYDSAVATDTNTNEAIETLNFEKMAEEGDACGKIPVLTAIDLAKRRGWKCKMLEYKNSGDITGTRTRVVGYASFALYL